MKYKMFVLLGLVFLATLFLLYSCIAFKYVYFERDKVVLNNLDVDKTLDIAELKLEEGGFDSILTVWAIRDQIINPEQASRISGLYFKYIDKINNEFGIWHLAWAISNYYRLGDDQVKEKLLGAYEDAKKRPDTLKQFKKIADEHINGKKIYMGFIHDLGKSFAHNHLIVPGDRNFLQSFDEFVKKNKKNKKLMDEIEKKKSNLM
jgi:hypothetical protein